MLNPDQERILEILADSIYNKALDQAVQGIRDEHELDYHVQKVIDKLLEEEV